MRVLIASETYPPDVNGAAYFVQRLGSRLAERGHDVCVVCPETDGLRDAGEAVQLRESPSRAVPLYPQVRMARFFAARREVQRAIAELRPDIIHVQNHFSVGSAALKEAQHRGIPVVATNHFLPTNVLVYLPVPRFVEPLVERFLWAQLRRAYGGVAVVTAPTSYAADLTARVCRRDVEIVSCGVDDLEFRPDVSPAAFRERYGIPAGPTVLAVGRLDPEKNLDELVRALPLLRSRVDAHLVIVGRGLLQPTLDQLARRLDIRDNVTFCGFVPDDLMPSAYAAGDVYCHAGTAELQSISTLEAMASGKPIVAADARALPLLVTDAVNGYLYPPGDVASLAHKLGTVLSDDVLKADMGEASRRSVQSHSIETHVAEFEAAYTRAIAAEGARAAPRLRQRALASTVQVKLRSAGTLAASLSLAVPTVVAVVRPEPAGDHVELVLSYLVAAISALAALGMAASFGLTRGSSRPAWLDAVAARRAEALTLGFTLALVLTLVATAARGVL